MATASGSGGRLTGARSYDAYMLFKVSDVAALPEYSLRGVGMIAMVQKA